MNNETNENATYDVEKYKMKKKEDLTKAYELIDKGMEQLQKDSDFLETYVNVQSHFYNYSVRNAILISMQMPNATQLREYKKWKELNVNFDEKYPKSIIILEPGQPYKNKDNVLITPFNAKKVIDISHTDIQENFTQYDKKMLLQALVSKDNPKIEAVDSLDNGKMASWDKDKNTIYVVRTEDYDVAIKSISKELAKANYYEKMDESELALKSDEHIDKMSDCISYMICKKYGVDKEFPKEEFMKIFSSMEQSKVYEELNLMKNSLNDINKQINKYLSIDTKEHDIVIQGRENHER